MNQWSGFILSECFEINLSERKEIIPESPGMCFSGPGKYSSEINKYEKKQLSF